MSQDFPIDEPAATPFGAAIEDFGVAVLGKVLADLREKAGLTQEGLARLLGRHRNTIDRWERAGKRSSRSLGDRSCHSTLTPALLLEAARRMGYTVAEVLKALRYHQELRPGQPPGTPEYDPLAPTEMESKVINYTALQVDGLMHRAQRKAKLDEHLARAGERLEKLLSSERHSARLAAIRTSRQFQEWALSLLFCQKSIRAAARDPKEARELAELAVEVANHVELPWKDRLRAFALAHLANALRVQGELDQADVMFKEALALWGSAPKDPGLLDPGRIYDLGASLRRAQRRFDEALALHEKAISLSRTSGRFVINKATTLEQMGHYDEAFAALNEADRSLIDREPRDEFNLAINRGVNACHLGKYEQAARYAQIAMEVADQLRNRLDGARALWLQARVKAGQRDLPAAKAMFELVKEELKKTKLGFDIALINTELAVVCLGLRQFPEVGRLAAQAATVFRKKQIHREALAAVGLFAEAVRRNEASVEFGCELVAFLYRARHDQSLVFSAPAL